MPTSAFPRAMRRAGAVLTLLTGVAAISATAYASGQLEDISGMGQSAHFSLFAAPLEADSTSMMIASMLLLGAIAFRRGR